MGFDSIFVQPFIDCLHFFAHLFHGNFGLSIILMTVIVRFALFPLMMYQYKTNQKMKEQFAAVQPELKKLQEKYKHQTNPAMKQKMQQEMLELYAKHGVNPLRMGCLPLLIQFPILLGFYYAIQGSQEIASHSFLWFDLGKTDMILPLIAAAIYYFQFKVAQIGIHSNLQKQMELYAFLSPLLIAIFSFSAPAALPLYWSVSGAFLILQSLLFKLIFKEQRKDKHVDVLKTQTEELDHVK